MLLKKQGLPEEGELVFCTVTNVQYNSVFVNIEEFDKSGLIHISEISPGRIRNIRDFVKEGKMVVCKVIKVDKSRGNVDLSLRRVTEIQKRQKTDERKQEQKAEKIVESVAAQLKLPIEKVYAEISGLVLQKYELLSQAFEDVIENNISLKELGLSGELLEVLEKNIREKIKPKEVMIGGIMAVKSFAPDGVEIVKQALIKARAVSPQVDIRYLGAGAYSVEVIAKEYKEAEKILKESTEIAEAMIEKSKSGDFKFTRREKD